MVYSHRDWAILWAEGGAEATDWILIDLSVLAPVQLIQSVPSILLFDRGRCEMASYKQFQKHPTGYKVKLSYS